MSKPEAPSEAPKPKPLPTTREIILSHYESTVREITANDVRIEELRLQQRLLHDEERALLRKNRDAEKMGAEALRMLRMVARGLPLDTEEDLRGRPFFPEPAPIAVVSEEVVDVANLAEAAANGRAP